MNPGAIHYLGLRLPWKTITCAAFFLTTGMSMVPTAGAAILYDSNVEGFDSCVLPTTSQMATWWQYSPYWWYGVYIGGSDNCGGGTPTASWVGTVTSQGWALSPIWVGPQDPCWTGGSTFSSDASTAFSQGEQQASLARAALQNEGFNPNQANNDTIEYDMEGFNNKYSYCIPAEQAFIKGWDQGLGSSPGQVFGVYGSTCSSYLEDLTGSPAPDYIFGADQDGNPSTTDMACVPSGDWYNQQRLKQYEGSHDETYPTGGVSLYIDSDNANGPLYWS